MPDTLSHELASIAEPLSVVLQATKRAQSPQPGSSVLILGCGAVGLLAAALCKAMGSTRITVVDIDAAKLEFCKAQGWCDETVVLPRGPRVSGKESLEVAKGLAADFEKRFGTDGWDCVFECSGVEVSLSILQEFFFYSFFFSSKLLVALAVDSWVLTGVQVVFSQSILMRMLYPCLTSIPILSSTAHRPDAVVHATRMLPRQSRWQSRVRRYGYPGSHAPYQQRLLSRS